ncbi:charged multivesicular body protein 3 [Folsomia candida]|uniref:Charged multivesicular body protein 3 n=1 Tax=Folsomia candida TaxID=158441 RepID=A0A226DGU5_FOLCA|nr:charged multivesicular body protein 3 [Folsomia candida]OXA44178.1 Charged multivesicular body protein 3 [Folsomia candida]
MGLFGKSPESDPKVQVTEWTKKIRRESTSLDRQVRGIQREEEKIKRSLKDAAKKGDKDVCRVYAKELVRSKKAIGKLYTSKAHLNSIQMHMKEQLAVLKTTGALQKSTQVMQSVQALVKIPEVAATMRELSKEMMKAGILEEMVNDTFESLEDQEELEEAADEEIDNILWEVTAGQIGKAPPAGTRAMPQIAPPAEESEDEEEIERMQNRLEALRS